MFWHFSFSIQVFASLIWSFIKIMNFYSVSFVCMPSSRMRLSCYIIFCTSLNPIFFSFLNFCSIKRSLIILSKKIILAHSNIFLALVKKLEQNKDRALFTYVWAKFVLALQASSSLSLSCCLASKAQTIAWGKKRQRRGGKTLKGQEKNRTQASADII